MLCAVSMHRRRLQRNDDRRGDLDRGSLALRGSSRPFSCTSTSRFETRAFTHCTQNFETTHAKPSEAKGMPFGWSRPHSSRPYVFNVKHERRTLKEVDAIVNDDGEVKERARSQGPRALPGPAAIVWLACLASFPQRTDKKKIRCDCGKTTQSGSIGDRPAAIATDND